MKWHKRFIALIVIALALLYIFNTFDFHQNNNLTQVLPFGKFGRLLLNNRLTFKDAAENNIEYVQLLENYDVMIKDHQIIYNENSIFDSNYSHNLTPDIINVHVVMHSHVDPGWLFTFEEYFNNKVHKILNYTVEYLSNNSDMRFIWSEMSFLERWWKEATEEQKEKMKKIIKNEQLELSGGAWVMTDEATPHFFGTIDNMIEGHYFVKKTFNITPSTSWSVDPFGHGLMIPYLLTESGINSMVIGRINNELKKELRNNHLLLFKWAQIWDNNDIIMKPIVSTLPKTYYTTSDSCGPDSNVCCQYDLGPSARSTCSERANYINEENVEKYATNLVNQYKQLWPYYIGNSLLIPVGDDFFYSHNDDWSTTYNSYKTLFEYINGNRDKYHVNVKFSTVKEYFDDIKTQDNKYPIFTGDFFPYTEDKFNTYPYWTGFYVHRPFFKRAERLTESKLRAIDILSILSDYPDIIENIRSSRRDLALCQHHDSITGTSKPKVMNDYMLRLETSFQVINEEIKNIIYKRIVPGIESFSLLVFPHDNSDGITNLHLITFTSEIRSHQLIVFNQNTKNIMQKIVLRVNDPRIKVLYQGNEIPSQIMPIMDNSIGKFANNVYELIFFIELNSFEIKNIMLYWSQNQPDSTILSMIFKLNPRSLHEFTFVVMPLNDTSDFSLSNRFFSVKFSNGIITSIRKSGNNMSNTLHVNYKNLVDHGGAYTFVNHGLFTLPMTGQKLIRTFSPIYIVGPLVSKSITEISPALIQNVVIDNGNSLSDLSIHIELYSNQETIDVTQIMEIKTNVNNKNKFYTDINGMYFTERNYNQNVLYEGNYYPIPTSTFIEDDNYRLTILSGQPTGVTVVNNTINMMIDRKLSGEDGKGLGRGDAQYSEPSLLKYDILFEEKIIQNNTNEPIFYSNIAYFNLQNLLYQPEMFILRNQSSIINRFKNMKWPCNIELINVRFIDNNTGLILLRKLPFDQSLPLIDCLENDYETLYNSLMIFSQNKPLYVTSLTGTIDSSTVEIHNIKQLFNLSLKIVALKFYLKG